MSNEVTVKTSKGSLMAAQKMYVESIGNGLASLIGKMDSYQAVCGYNILSAINQLLKKEGLDHTSPGIDKESINDAIKFAVIYRLNADNRELFVILRNTKIKKGDKEVWVKAVECKVQYRGHLKILSHYGKDVEQVYPEWIVREGDDFTYPTYRGIELIPPTWTRKSTEGKVLRVVVPVKFKDGYIDYRIADRESVATNIKAQIKQTLMYDKQKDSVLALIKDYSLEQLLTDPNITKYVNDTYTGLSSEEMIITKLILNATKRIPIDYESALARELMEKTYDNADVYVKNHNAEEIIANGMSAIEMQQPVEEEITAQPETVKEEAPTVKTPLHDDDGVVLGETVEKPKPTVSSLFEDDDDRPF